MYKMLIVENDNFLKELLTEYFNESGKYKVVGSITDASFAPSICHELGIDVALLDICTDDGNYGGIVAGTNIKRMYPHIKVILMTGIPEANFISEAHLGKIDSFLYKSDTIENLYNVVEMTMAGENIWPEEDEGSRQFSKLEIALSNREKEVARLICCNCMTRIEIAEFLDISPNSVKTITSRLFTKVGVDNARELMKFMLANDFFIPEE